MRKFRVRKWPHTWLTADGFGWHWWLTDLRERWVFPAVAICTSRSVWSGDILWWVTWELPTPWTLKSLTKRYVSWSKRLGCVNSPWRAEHRSRRSVTHQWQQKPSAVSRVCSLLSHLRIVNLHLQSASHSPERLISWLIVMRRGPSMNWAESADELFLNN